MDEQKQFTLFAGEPTAEGIYKNKKTKAQLSFVKAAEMKEAFPAGGYRVVGQIGKGKEQIGVLHDEDADEPVYKSQKMGLTKIVGFVQVGENEFVAVLKSTVWLLLLILLLSLLLCLGLGFFIYKVSTREPMPPAPSGPQLSLDAFAEEGEGHIDIPEKTETKGKKITIKGVAEVHLKADEKKQNFVFQNPATNPCFFVIEMVLSDTGETIYMSDLVPPGYSISEFSLTRPLKAGTYPVTVKYHTYSFDKELTPLNDSKVNTVLVVE